MYGFSIRGQRFVFQDRASYLEAFSRAIDIANEQEIRYEPPDEQLTLPHILDPPMAEGINLPQLEG